MTNQKFLIIPKVNPPTNLFSILPPRGVKTLDKICGMTQKHCITSSTTYH